jgi:ribose/xylose/arabinose/galactoside ABC-type transport system permease subunit
VKHKSLVPWLVLGLLVAGNALFTPGFLRLEVRDGRVFGALVDILNRGAPVALLALGMTPVIATAGIDLSVGSVMALASSLIALVAARGEGSIALAIAAALGAGLVLGAWNGALVAFLKLAPILATLVLLTAGRGIAELLSGGGVATIADPDLARMGRLSFLGLPISVSVVAVVFVSIVVLARRTTFGLHVEAIGGNPRASRLAGLPVVGVLIGVFALSGLCAAIAGTVVCADVGAADASRIGLYLELDAILAVVIGGTSLAGGRMSLAGSLAGALVNQTLTTMLYLLGLSTAPTLCIKAALLLLVVGFQSEALLAGMRRIAGGMRVAR